MEIFRQINLRRVAILLALLAAVIEIQAGQAIDEYTVESEQTVQRDITGQGSADATGTVTSAGELMAWVTATSNSQIASEGIGKRDFDCTWDPTFPYRDILTGGKPSKCARAIGANRAKSESNFSTWVYLPEYSQHLVTITLNVSEITKPTEATADMSSVSGLNGQCVFVPFIIDECPYLYNSDAQSIVYLYLDLDVGGQTWKSVGPGGDGYEGGIDLGLNTVTLTTGRVGPIATLLRIYLLADAWAIGKNASASAGAVLTFVSIEVSPKS